MGLWAEQSPTAETVENSTVAEGFGNFSFFGERAETVSARCRRIEGILTVKDEHAGMAKLVKMKSRNSF